MEGGAAQIVVTTVVENYVDMLLADAPNVARAGLVHHFDPKRACPLAENGVSLHVDLTWGSDRRYQVLFDTAMTGGPLLHNASALGISMQALDHVIISHGHPDHYGGLLPLLDAREFNLPVSLHDDAFLPRYLRLASGEVAPYYNQALTPEAIDSRGGRLVRHKGPLEVGPFMLATGQIRRDVDFEAPPESIDTPNALIQVVDGEMVPDVVRDDQALVINVGSDGIVVLVGCSHAGIINTLHHAIELSGRNHILAVFGGFHLGFPGTPGAKTAKTIEALRELHLDLLCPMHCTGMASMMEMARELPTKFLLNCTGTRVVIDATREGSR